MRDTQAQPNIYSVPVGCDFTVAFLDGLRDRFQGEPPEAMARVEIFAGSQNGASRIREILESGPAALLPRIRLLDDLADDPLVPGVTPKRDPGLERTLALRRLVAALLEREPDLAPVSAAFELAASLEGLVAEFHDEGIGLERVLDLEVEDQSGHWQRSLKFLRILYSVFEAGGQPDRRSRVRAAVEALDGHWRSQPPGHPVIVAGSTGTSRSMMLFMRAVASLPRGAVVLPGVDAEMPADVWPSLHDGECDEHPQAAVHRFCAAAGVSALDLPPWSGLEPACPARNRLVSLALRPAPVTDRWMSEGPGLLTEIAAAAAGMSLILAPGVREEANAVAVAMREAIETGSRAALVTQDRELARRVDAALRRWSIEPDNRIGEPLQQTPAGVFLRLVLDVLQPQFAPQAFVALLKHPLTNSANRKQHLRHTASLERHLRAECGPAVDSGLVQNWAHGRDGERAAWGARLAELLAGAPEPGGRPLADWLRGHVRLANALVAWQGVESGPFASDAEVSGPLWEGMAGSDLGRMFDDLAAHAAAAGEVDIRDYRAMLRSLMQTSRAYGQTTPRPDAAIWGGHQARVRSTDLVVIGGLNEGTWPGSLTPDAWLNRAMRRRLGLGPPERRHGLAAHDFQQAAGSAKVVLSRSLRRDDAPAVESRWLTRILNLMRGLGAEGGEAVDSMTARGDRWLDLARSLERPKETVARAGRPAPAPPPASRPERLSVTQIRTLIRDPYAIYARHVLKLRRLDPVGREPDALARGIAIHGILERFVAEIAAGRAAPSAESFLALAEAELLSRVPWPMVRRFWLARLRRAADWIVEGESERSRAGTSVGAECGGSLSVGTGGFTLTARADRIDRDDAGRLLIYDYKSGKPPTAKVIKSFDKQLQLEAAMAARGGFEGIPAAPVGRLQYIGLGSEKIEDIRVGDGLFSDVLQELEALLAAYSDPRQGYCARARMQRTGDVSDYDQLSRFGEWDVTDAPERRILS